MTTSPKYRVLHVIDSFNVGGAQTALIGLIRYADRSRFEPEVACMHGRGVFWEDFSALGVCVHSLSPSKWLPLYVWRLARLVMKRRFDIVHCHLFGANWIAKPVAALLGMRVRISHAQCNDRLLYDSRLARWLDSATNRLSTHVCAVSRSTRDFLVEREGVPETRVSVVYNGVDTKRYTPVKGIMPGRALRVVGVGRLHSQKDFSLFLDVAAELTRRKLDVHFIIAGIGPEEAALRSKAQAPALAGRVQFVGHVADPRTIYAAADVLLLTSRYEGTPLVVLEAMACGVPVVAPKVDGLQEVLVDGEDSFLVSQGACGQFADRVAELLGNSNLRARLAGAARTKVTASFSAEQMAAQVEAIYQRYLAAGR